MGIAAGRAIVRFSDVSARATSILRHAEPSVGASSVLARYRRIARALLGVACLAAIGALAITSFSTDGDVRIGFAYLPILVGAGWWLDPLVAFSCAAAAATAVFAGDVTFAGDVSPTALLWNEFTRVTTLLATPGFVMWLRRTRERLRIEREALRSIAITDPLTGLYNRRFLDEEIASVHARAVRSKRPYAVLAIDVNGLKRLNDHHGHAAGDAALVALASDLRDCARQGDILVRTGGDEFIVLLPDTAADDAEGVARRIERRAAEPHADSPQRVSGVSIGVAGWREGLATDEVLRRADEAMYANKPRARP
jgi:diguanylate cyclase (GGDEF)-like protein